jgi:D-alanyl-D-alanine carboxypeptidase/D-alanyl-D-alanine-endopeptidase (penicillin-binding protein 4)
MPRARWWVIGALSVVTVLVVLLDVSGVIFQEDAEPLPAPPVALPEPLDPMVAAPAALTSAPPERSVVNLVERLLQVDALGSSVHAVVAPLGDPEVPWLDVDGEAPATPASTVKLWTAASVLDAVPAESRLTTSTSWDAASSTVTLVGTGDATLATDPTSREGVASLSELARLTARRLTREDISDAPVRLVYDSSAFSGPSVSPRWEPTYVTSGVIAPVTALMVDQGRVAPGSDARWPEPDLAAAVQFAALLDEQGLAVRGEPRPGSDPAGAVELASVRSPQVGDLVERMLRDSDNQLAEALGRVGAAASGRPASFDGATEAMLAAAERAGADMSDAALYDASGLSRDNAVTADSLVDALHLGATSVVQAPMLSGLPVAGFDGTLADRFETGSAAGAGVVRAKTGTLTGITAEAGVVTSCDGVLLAFAFVADEVADTEAARAAFDGAAAALSRCPRQR